MDANAEMKWRRENAEKRRVWEEDFARRKEEERTRHAREELARERKSRLDSWMSHGGDPEDFERAWPSIMQEKLKARQERAEDIWS